VASISANDPKIGKMIANMIKEIGNDGVILVEESQQNMEIHTEVTKGTRFNRGYKSNWMVTNPEKLESEFKDPFILVTDKKITSQHDIVAIMKLVAANGKNEMVVICEDVEGEALSNILINGGNGVFRMLVVKAPEFGERKTQTLEDIALLTGGRFINTELGGMQLKDVQISDLGKAEKVVSSRDYTVIAGGKGDDKKIADRVKEIRTEIENSESNYEKEKIRIRLGNLTGGVGVIKVGAGTESEVKEIRDRVEDAVNSTKAALEGGILPGGGSTLLNIYQNLENSSILKTALLEPIKQIAKNAGKEPVEVLLKVMEGLRKDTPNFGYDAMENVYREDMIKSGIIDATKVTKMALDTACSIATMVLGSEVLVTEMQEKKENI
jgi:chaperonin GroEL